MARASCKKDHHSLFKVLVSPVLGKKLGKCTAFERREYRRLHPLRPAYLRYIDAVHYGRQHAYLIRLRPVYVLTGASSPEITASDNHAYLYVILRQLLYLKGHLSHSAFIKTGLLFSRKGFTA